MHHVLPLTPSRPCSVNHARYATDVTRPPHPQRPHPLPPPDPDPAPHHRHLLPSPRPRSRVELKSDYGLGDEWEASLLDEVIRATDEAEAVVSHDPSPTHTPHPLPSPCIISWPQPRLLPPSPFGLLHPCLFAPLLRDQLLPSMGPLPAVAAPPPTAPTSTRDALATGADVGHDFYPPPQLSQRPTANEGSLVTVVASSSASDRRFI
jgi:hypothetical protein